SLTRRGASWAARPIHWRPGDIRDAGHRSRWTLERRSLLHRAIEQHHWTWQPPALVDRRHSEAEYWAKQLEKHHRDNPQPRDRSTVEHSPWRGRIVRVSCPGPFFLGGHRRPRASHLFHPLVVRPSVHDSGCLGSGRDHLPFLSSFRPLWAGGGA